RAPRCRTCVRQRLRECRQRRRRRARSRLQEPLPCPRFRLPRSESSLDSQSRTRNAAFPEPRPCTAGTGDQGGRAAAEPLLATRELQPGSALDPVGFDGPAESLCTIAGALQVLGLSCLAPRLCSGDKYLTTSTATSPRLLAYTGQCRYHP